MSISSRKMAIGRCRLFQSAEARRKRIPANKRADAEIGRAWRGMGFAYVEETASTRRARLSQVCLERDTNDAAAIARDSLRQG